MSDYVAISDKDQNLAKVSRLLNGHIIDIYKFVRSNNLSNDKLLSFVCQISGNDIEHVNVKSLMTKVNRVYKNDCSKRGEYRNIYRDEPFNVPTCSVTAKCSTSTAFSTKEDLPDVSDTKAEQKLVIKSLGEELTSTKGTLVKTEGNLIQNKSKLKELQEKNKQLKRKLEVREDYFSLSKKSKLMDNKIKMYDRKLHRVTELNTKLKTQMISLKKSAATKTRNVGAFEKDIHEKDERIQKFSTEIDQKDEQISSMKNEMHELKTSNDYLCSLLDDNNQEVVLFDEVKKHFTTECVQCIMNLTSFKVASQQVGNIIKEVCKLCGKYPNKVPSRSTVDNITDRKASVCHKQIGQVLKNKSCTTLYTDETRKYGRTVESCAVSDDEGSTYVLGLREMSNKSASTTLDTLKTILHDIDVHCKINEEDSAHSVGYQILSNIKNTMSDRASTEKSFNMLLKQYRSEILPLVLHSWEDLNEEERGLLTSMNNFYCGLHLLVGMADVAESSILKFESNYLDSKEVGSAIKPELKRFHKHESGTLRLLRTSSKAFSMGGDEKNGVFSQWNTYLKSKGIKNSIVRFKHNRFNLIFLLGQCVFFHREDMKHFLSDVHGTPNTLLKAVLLDVQEPLFLAGVRCLGLIAKCISSPLWRKIESSGHILEMNDHFQELVTFFEECSKDANTFLRGQNLPYGTPEDDNVFTKLMEPSELDSICVAELQSIFLSLKELLKRMVCDHLPGGKYFAPSTNLVLQTRSAKKHNKLPEFIFGQLDHLMHYRPNASSLVNETFIMYNHNKGREWLEGLDNDTRTQIIEESRKEGREFRRQFQQRLSDIESQRREAQKKKQEENERKEQNRIKKGESLTNDVCYYGLWQSRKELEEGIARLESDGMKQKALESQIKFRKDVLLQKHHDKKIFTFSAKQANGKYAKHSLETLKNNVLRLIEGAMSGPQTETSKPDVPLFVGKDIDHKFSDGCTYKGRVVCVVPGFPSWYNVIYENDPALYVYNLMEDYKNGDVKLRLEHWYKYIKHASSLEWKFGVTIQILTLFTSYLYGENGHDNMLLVSLGTRYKTSSDTCLIFTFEIVQRQHKDWFDTYHEWKYLDPPPFI